MVTDRQEDTFQLSSGLYYRPSENEDAAFKKKKDIHNAWTTPFISLVIWGIGRSFYAIRHKAFKASDPKTGFCLNGNIEREFREAQLYFKTLKDALKEIILDDENTKEFAKRQDQYEDLYYQTLRSHYYLRIAHERKLSVATEKEFEDLDGKYRTELFNIASNFASDISFLECTRDSNSEPPGCGASFCYIAKHACTPLSDLYAIWSSVGGFITKTLAMIAEYRLQAALRHAAPHIADTLKMFLVLPINFLTLMMSYICALKKDIDNWSRKPTKSALKVLGGMMASIVIVMIILAFVPLPPIPAITLLVATFLVMREVFRCVGRLHAYRQTGSTNPEKYLLNKNRIEKLREMDVSEPNAKKRTLTYREIETLRSHIAAQILHAKQEQTEFLGRGIYRFFAATWHSTTNTFTSHRRHSTKEKFWKEKMRQLQEGDEEKLKKLIEVYNKFEPSYAPKLLSEKLVGTVPIAGKKREEITKEVKKFKQCTLFTKLPDSSSVMTLPQEAGLTPV